MKNFAFGFVVLFGSALALTPGCGDDEATTEGGGSGGTAGGGGSTSKGGSASGGDATDAGSTSVGGEPAGPNGGMPSAGGAPGAGGAGFMNPEGCPAEAPMNDDDCFVNLDVQTSCEYPGSRCVCNGYMAAGGAGGATAGAGNWICRGAGADCPDAAPSTGDACDQNVRCPYPGDIDCACQGGEWACEGAGNQGAGGGGGAPSAGACPATEPTAADPCDGPIASCFYDDSNTLCSCPSRGPGADEWACESF
jgi:hypothetical protein